MGMCIRRTLAEHHPSFAISIGPITVQDRVGQTRKRARRRA